MQAALQWTIGDCVLERNPLNFNPIGVHKVHHFTRRTSLINSYTTTSGSFTTSADIATFAQNDAVTPSEALVALAFRLDDLPDYTEFTNLFDQYALIGVQVNITPRKINASVSTASNIGPNMLYVAYDASDITLPASLAVLREYQTVKEFSDTTMTNRKWVKSCSPRIAVAAYAGAFSGYSAPPMTWIDTQSPTVQHYGLKMGIPAGYTAGTVNFYDMDFIYHIACRLAQ